MTCDVCNKTIDGVTYHGFFRHMCSEECWRKAQSEYKPTNKGGNDPTAKS